MATRIVIPTQSDYRETVRKLLDIIKPWGLGCFTKQGVNDDQILVEKPNGADVTLTREQHYEILMALPKVEIVVWYPDNPTISDL